MTAQIPYSVKELYNLAKKMEVNYFSRIKAGRSKNNIFNEAFVLIFDWYQQKNGNAAQSDLTITYDDYSSDSSLKSIALATKDLIQQALNKAGFAYLVSATDLDFEVIEYEGYKFTIFTKKAQDPQVLEKTVVVKENNTDEILRAIARSEEQAANFNKTLPDLFPKSKEYDAELDGLKQELEKMRDYFTLLQQKTEQIINEFNISTTAVNQLIDKASEENRQLLNQMLQKEYNPVITVEAPEVKMPEIPAPKVEVNVMQVAEEIRVSLRAIVKHLDERLDKMSEPKEVTFKVVYDKDKWPVEVVVKEIN